MARLLIKTVAEKVVEEATGIRSITLAHVKGRELPSFEGGAHVDVHLGNGAKRQYSLCSDPADRSAYRIGVLRAPAGRGGSEWLHEHVQVGDTLIIGSPRNTFRLAQGAGRHVLVAGGIGITPFVSMMHELRRRRESFELHYCSRSPETTAFVEELAELEVAGAITHYFDAGDPRRGCNVSALLEAPRPGSHVYCCGPKGLVGAVERATRHWPSESVHFEHFAGTEPIAGEILQSFELVLSRSGRHITVAADETTLGALWRAGVPVDAGCESGACGACITQFVGGTPIHRDVCLSDAERQRSFAPCVSRARGVIELDL